MENHRFEYIRDERFLELIQTHIQGRLSDKGRIQIFSCFNDLLDERTIRVYSGTIDGLVKVEETTKTGIGLLTSKIRNTIPSMDDEERKHFHVFRTVTHQEFFNQKSSYSNRGNIEVYELQICKECPKIRRVYSGTIDGLVKVEEAAKFGIPRLDKKIAGTIWSPRSK